MCARPPARPPQEVAEAYGLSRERIRQIEDKALKVLFWLIYFCYFWFNRRMHLARLRSCLYLSNEALVSGSQSVLGCSCGF